MIVAAGVILSAQAISAQKEIFNPVYTGVTSLSIAPDSRAGAMGDVGCATDPYMDNNNQYWNPSKYPFTKSQAGVSLCYTPWLRKLQHFREFSFHRRRKEPLSAGAERTFFPGREKLHAAQSAARGTRFENERRNIDPFKQLYFHLDPVGQHLGLVLARGGHFDPRPLRRGFQMHRRPRDNYQ